jgi:hypothetical protein
MKGIFTIKTPYCKQIEYFESKNCKIITSEEEYSKSKGKSRVDIISSCGHESNNIQISRFRFSNTGVICKKCSHKNCEYSKSIGIENDAYKIIKDNCPSIDIENTNDGCRADFIVKPKGSLFWLPFQLKSTTRTDSYCFKIKGKDYSGMMIIFIAITDNKAWILDNTIIDGNICVSIGKKKSKYSIFEVSYTELENKIIECYEKYKSYLTEKNLLLIPVSVSQQIEHEYRIIRETKLSFLEFSNSLINQQVYDFTINGYKVQEKVSRRIGKNDNYIHLLLHRNNGNVDKVRKFKSYDKGDNDFYWIHFPDKKTFLIIPENIFIEKGIVHCDNNKQKSMSIDINKIEQHWVFPYLHSYENPDEEKLKKIFNIV